MIALRIALRYLCSRKSHAAVNIISAISVAGVAVATAAIVIVLSVFNGFTAVSETRLSAIDPQIKIVPSAGKAWTDVDSILSIARGIIGVAKAMPVIEERGLAINGTLQKPVIFKGVPSDYPQLVDIESTIIDGVFADSAYFFPASILSVGVAMGLQARPGTASVFDLYVPRRTGRINPANPSAAFRGSQLIVTGVMQIDQPEYDNDYLIIPLETARQLLEYDQQATAVEVLAHPNSQIDQIANELNRALAGKGKALTRAQQEESSFRMIQIEKWITFMMLAFILVISSFNIISTLSLLALEKRDNMVTLRSMGATRSMVRRVFMWLGIDISVAGGVIGILLGAILVLAQQYGHFIKLAGNPAQMSIHYYPVRLEIGDLLMVLALVAIVAIVSAAIAMALAKTETNKNT